MEDIEAGRPTTVVAATLPTESGNADNVASAPPTATIDPSDVDNVKSCPICVEDFEEGDDLRILPCEGRHAYHRDCIDPWLLGVSSLCPLCRLDLAGDAPAEPEEIDYGAEQVAEQRSSGFIRRFRQRSGTRTSNDEGTGHGQEATGTTTTSTTTTASRFRRYVANRRRRN